MVKGYKYEGTAEKKAREIGGPMLRAGLGARVRKEAMQLCYDLAKEGLLAQGCRSEGSYYDPRSGTREWGCKYRGSRGRKCAIGFLIQDHEYDPKMEGGRVTIVLSHLLNRPVEDFDRFDSRICFLRQLQEVHDNYEPERWPEVLARVAELWDLRP